MQDFLAVTESPALQGEGEEVLPDPLQGRKGWILSADVKGAGGQLADATAPSLPPGTLLPTPTLLTPALQWVGLRYADT